MRFIFAIKGFIPKQILFYTLFILLKLTPKDEKTVKTVNTSISGYLINPGINSGVNKKVDIINRFNGLPNKRSN